MVQMIWWTHLIDRIELKHEARMFPKKIQPYNNCFQIYVNYLNLIVNIFIPLTSLIVMNICIYRIMHNQWYSQTGLAESEQNVENCHGYCFSRKRTTTLSTGHIRRAGHHEAEYKKRDAQYTRASVFMVVAFVVCNTPRFIPNVMEIFIELKDWPQASGNF